MRVLLVNTLYPPDSEGGAERSVAGLAEGLAGSGVEVSVLALRTRGSGEDDRERVRRIALRNLYWPYDGRKRPALLRVGWHLAEAFGGAMDDPVAAAVEATRPDLIHLHVPTGFGRSVFRAARRSGVPLVQTVRDYSMLCARSAMFREGERCVRGCRDCVLLTAPKRRVSRLTEEWIAISEHLREAHRAAGCFDGSPGRVIGNPAPAVRPAPRPSFETEPNLVFGFIGRIQPEKGIEVLLAATRRLESDWRLRIAGRGEASYVERLKRDHSDPRIEWLGQAEPDAFYGGVDVVVAPALWAEPFGRVAAEATAHGRGLILSRGGGLAEAAGRASFVLDHDPGDVAGLAAAMAAVLGEPQRWRHGAMANSQVPSVWTETTVVEAHLALYRGVLTRASRTAADVSQR